MLKGFSACDIKLDEPVCRHLKIAMIQPPC